MANESYTNEVAYHTYRQAEQAVLDAKVLRKKLLKDGEQAAEQAKYGTVGTLQKKLTAIRAAWAPFNEKIAQLDEEIKNNYAIADENFDIWKGLNLAGQH